MAEMKAALAQLKESAAADARYKSALKHNTEGGGAKLVCPFAALPLCLSASRPLGPSAPRPSVALPFCPSAWSQRFGVGHRLR